MNEENKHPGTELNDAALENVSGAGYESDYVMAAREVCNSCPKNGQSCSTLLAKYMKDVRWVNDPSFCPFSDVAKGG